MVGSSFAYCISALYLLIYFDYICKAIKCLSVTDLSSRLGVYMFYSNCSWCGGRSSTLC